jgi:hypothetical protein
VSKKDLNGGSCSALWLVILSRSERRGSVCLPISPRVQMQCFAASLAGHLVTVEKGSAVSKCRDPKPSETHMNTVIDMFRSSSQLLSISHIQGV